MLLVLLAQMNEEIFEELLLGLFDAFPEEMHSLILGNFCNMKHSETVCCHFLFYYPRNALIQKHLLIQMIAKLHKN